MIPDPHLEEWSALAPWRRDYQVEQDLIISRALVDLYNSPIIASSLAFRGATALYKLHIPAARYSEDIDLVQVRPERIGPVIDAVREALAPWLGKPSYRQKDKITVFYFRYTPASPGPPRPRLKVEINTQLHFSLFGLRDIPFSMKSGWFQGSSEVLTYEVDEMMGTKLRALYQRIKGRDLFDLAHVLRTKQCDPERVLASFAEYNAREDEQISRAQLESNFARKLKNPNYGLDVRPLLKKRENWNMREAARIVSKELISRLPGEPWKGAEDA